MKKYLKELLFKPRVVFNDLKSIKPISNVFGFDRGTPIDRYYINRFLQSNRTYIKGKVLEISESVYSKKYGAENVKCEIMHFDSTNPNATIIGDLTRNETLPSNEIDCFICTQTFNVIYDVKKAIAGAYYLLKDNGILLSTVAGLTQISRFDMDRWGDYWRFTDLSVKNLFKEVGFKEVEITVYGNVIAAIALLQGLAVEDLPESKMLDKVDQDYQILIGIVARK